LELDRFSGRDELLLIRSGENAWGRTRMSRSSSLPKSPTQLVSVGRVTGKDDAISSTRSPRDRPEPDIAPDVRSLALDRYRTAGSKNLDDD